MYERSLFWFRRDLRLKDNTGLAQATQQSKKVIPVFVFDTSIINKLTTKNDRRLSFIAESINDLEAQLSDLGSSLIVRIGDPKEIIPKLARELKVQAVYLNKDYEPSAIQRDNHIAQSLEKQNIEMFSFKDQVVFEGLEVKNGSGEPYKVFTPYMKAWRAKLSSEDIEERLLEKGNLVKAKAISSIVQKWSLVEMGFKPVKNYLKGSEAEAQRRLKLFLKQVDQYADKRDFPAAKGTSKLSVYLRFGNISIRELVRAVIQRKGKGAEVWLNELIWREFYQMILKEFPHVAKDDFKPQYGELNWSTSQKQFLSWCNGQTGYPIIDAAMKCLVQTGWMHNRLRMIVASFLTKDLLIDWRKGERFFAKHLLDYDMASNVGGWQWSASTGVDAAPYFRIFNPILQSKKFDPDGEFIKQWLPELKELPREWVHFPCQYRDKIREHHPELVKTLYLKPIVDHMVQKKKATLMFEEIV
jgi:deoxyribodipyrimidine photo-lyase